MSKILICILLIIPPITIYSQTNFWTQTNGPFSGTVYDYSFGENNIVYAGADSGVYKSTDYGMTWNSIPLPNTSFYSVCKLKTGITLAGSASALYRTTNDGLNYSMSLFANFFYDIKEINSGLIIAATGNGIYKSTNQGLNWELTLGVFARSIETSNINEIYTATSDGLYKSTNNSISWHRFENFNYPLFSVDVADNGFIFATEYNEFIFRSTNNGLTFIDIGHRDSNSIYKPTKTIVTTDGYLYCGTFYQGIWKSSDLGDTWEKQYPGERVNFFVTNLCEGINGDVFGSVSNCSVVRTTDHGIHWNRFKYRNKYITANILLPSSNGRIFSNDGFVSIDDGWNWTYPDFDFLPTSYTKSPITNTLLATDGSSVASKIIGIYRSTDNGNDWYFIRTDKIDRWLQNLYASRVGDVYVNGGGLNRSTNDGTNWFHVSDSSCNPITSSNSDVLFGKRYGPSAGVYRSTNHGQSWESVLPLANGSGQMYVTDSGDVYAGGNNTLYKSTNNGNNWTKENITGLVTSILENQNGKLFISTNGNGKVYKKDEDSLIDLTYNLNGRSIHTMCFNSYGQLLAGTDQGVYISNQSLIGINITEENIPTDFVLYQNYPNPFNPATKIYYDLFSEYFVILKLFDISGKEIAILVNEKQNAGRHSVNFNGSKLSSGLYFYKIEIYNALNAQKLTSTKKMMLLK